MPSNLCCPILLLPSICPSFRVFSNESVLRIRWPKYWSFSFSISPSNEYSGLVSSTETLPKSCRRRRISNSLCEASITLIPKQPEISHTHTFAGQYHWWTHYKTSQLNTRKPDLTIHLENQIPWLSGTFSQARKDGLVSTDNMIYTTSTNWRIKTIWSSQ